MHVDGDGEKLCCCWIAQAEALQMRLEGLPIPACSARPCPSAQEASLQKDAATLEPAAEQQGGCHVLPRQNAAICSQVMHRLRNTMQAFTIFSTRAEHAVPLNSQMNTDAGVHGRMRGRPYMRVCAPARGDACTQVCTGSTTT